MVCGSCVAVHPPAHSVCSWQGAVDACKIGSTIALRYSASRPQFGDKLIMDYLTHQRRLLPGLATAYALQLGMKQLKVCVHLCVGDVCGGVCMCATADDD
jgi:alkylation response protein AidB-like acyl-CoA dehydrogenase